MLYRVTKAERPSYNQSHSQFHCILALATSIRARGTAQHSLHESKINLVARFNDDPYLFLAPKSGEARAAPATVVPTLLLYHLTIGQ